MKNKFITMILSFYFAITLLIFTLEAFLDFGNPMFIIGQWLLLFGIVCLRYYTFMYLIIIIGLYMILYTLNIWHIDMYYFRYILVALFPILPTFLLFSEWNDKNRIMRNGGIELEATYKGADKFGRSTFEFYLDSQKYKATANRYSSENKYRKNDLVTIYVSTKNPQRIYNSPSKNTIKNIILASVITWVICLPIIIIMILE